jgi:H+/Cl- antiporter ClcA
VAVIRGNPPEELHEVLTITLSRIHSEYNLLLENFEGDSTSLEGVSCVAQRQQAPLQARTSFPWLVALVVLAVLLLVGAWGIHWWLGEQRWEDYVARRRGRPVLCAVGDGVGLAHASPTVL